MWVVYKWITLYRKHLIEKCFNWVVECSLKYVNFFCTFLFIIDDNFFNLQLKCEVFMINFGIVDEITKTSHLSRKITILSGLWLVLDMWQPVIFSLNVEHLLRTFLPLKPVYAFCSACIFKMFSSLRGCYETTKDDFFLQFVYKITLWERC